MVYFVANVKGLVILMNGRVSSFKKIIYLLPFYITYNCLNNASRLREGLKHGKGLKNEKSGFCKA